MDDERFQARVRWLDERIKNHPVNAPHHAWQDLGTVYSHIFKANQAELLLLLNEPVRNTDLAVELIQNVRPPTVRKQWFGEVVRRYHNYVAAMNTLVDHSRILVGRYDAASDFVREYELRRQAVSDSGEHRLIKHLRNAMLHVELPPVGVRLKLDRGEDGEFHRQFFVVLYAERLRNSRLRGAAQVAADARGPEIDLVRLFADHGDLVDGLYQWLLDGQFGLLHGAELDTRNALVSEMNALFARNGMGFPIETDKADAEP